MIGTVLAPITGLVAFAILLVSLPTCVYFALRLILITREDLPTSWLGGWRLNTLKILFFPRTPNEKTQYFQRMGIRAATWVVCGILLGLLSIYVFGLPPAIG